MKEKDCYFTGNSPSFDKMDCQCLEFYFVMKSRGSQELKSHSINADNEVEEMLWIHVVTDVDRK